MQEIKKVVITGPESTGKSSLCAQLAAHYNTLWCPEYAREYLEKNGTDYTYHDLLNIARGQLALEEQYIKILKEKKTANPVLFIDTDMYVMKVWCQFVFGKCHPFILDKINTQSYDLYLLCNIDLPWIKDDLREYPDLEIRKQLYNIYKNILTKQNVSWAAVSGGYEQRMAMAVTAIDKVI